MRSARVLAIIRLVRPFTPTPAQSPARSSAAAIPEPAAYRRSGFICPEHGLKCFKMLCAIKGGRGDKKLTGMHDAVVNGFHEIKRIRNNPASG